jgi:hypothetical protein
MAIFIARWERFYHQSFDFLHQDFRAKHSQRKASYREYRLGKTDSATGARLLRQLMEVVSPFPPKAAAPVAI